MGGDRSTSTGLRGLEPVQTPSVRHSAKHLDAYLGEMCYRYSRRDFKDCQRVDDLLSQIEGRLTYKALTHGKEDVREAAGD